MSSVPSPRDTKPKPRTRLNHFTTAISKPPSGATWTWVRAGGICEGCMAVERSSDRTRKTCRPLARRSTSQTIARPLVGGLEPVPAQARHVDQHVRHAVVGNDEPVALGTSNHLISPATSMSSAAVAGFQVPRSWTDLCRPREHHVQKRRRSDRHVRRPIATHHTQFFDVEPRHQTLDGAGYGTKAKFASSIASPRLSQ